MLYAKTKRNSEKKRLLKKINIEIYLKSIFDLSFLAFLNNNDIKFIALFNCIQLTQYSINIRFGKISNFIFLNDLNSFEFSKNAYNKFLL